jgi:hypothetical protein
MVKTIIATIALLIVAIPASAQLLCQGSYNRDGTFEYTLACGSGHNCLLPSESGCFGAGTQFTVTGSPCASRSSSKSDLHVLPEAWLAAPQGLCPKAAGMFRELLWTLSRPEAG